MFSFFHNSKEYEKTIVENWIRPKHFDLRMIATWLEGTYKSSFPVLLTAGFHFIKGVRYATRMDANRQPKGTNYLSKSHLKDIEQDGK